MRTILGLVMLLALISPARAAGLGVGDMGDTLAQVSAGHLAAPTLGSLWHASLRAIVKQLGTDKAGQLLFIKDPHELRRRLAVMLKALPASRASQVVRAGLQAALASTDDLGTTLYARGQYKRMLHSLGVGAGGVGFLVEPTRDSKGRYRIAKLIPGFPAQLQGIKQGDYLVGVGLSRTKDLDFAELAAKVRGPVGTRVRLLVQRKGAPPRTVVLTRQWLNLKPSEPITRLQGKSTGVIRTSSLGLGTRSQLRKAVAGLRKQGALNLVLDLRGCGGDLVGARQAAEVFLPRGAPVYQVVTRSRVNRITTSRAGDTRIPMVVLIGPRSGEAAAVLAGALRDDGRAVILGAATDPARTRALRWVALQLPDHSVATFTTAHILLPAGHALWRLPLVPDLTLSGPADQAVQDAVELLTASHGLKITPGSKPSTQTM